MLLRTLALACAALALTATTLTATVVVAEEAAKEEPLDPALEKLLIEEKAYRKACKIEICSILASRQLEGPDVACHVVKTWPKGEITKMIEKSRISWPLGNVHCEADLTVKREVLAKAMTEPDYVADIGKHKISCEIDREAEGEKHVIDIEISPKITFKDGKAVSAEINWGDITAPAVAKGVIWPAAKLDNSLGVFSDKVVEIVNTFATKKCDEVKDELKLN